MTGVQHESDAVASDLLPELGDPFHPPRHGLVPTCGVLDQDLHVGVQGIQGFPPPGYPFLLGTVAGHMSPVDHHRLCLDLSSRVTCLLKDLAAGDADSVVVGTDVDQVRRMHIDGKRGGAKLVGVFAWLGLLP